jgi:hypothetical protein
MEKKNFKLTVIEFTAYGKDGEKFFIADLSDENGDGKVIIKDDETKVEDAIKSLEHLCNTVEVHKVIEYELSVVSKKETTYKEKFEPVKQLENAAA